MPIQALDTNSFSRPSSSNLTSRGNLRRPEEQLRQYGWLRRDVDLFMQTFARAKAPFWISPPGRKDYFQPFFRNSRTKERRARGLTSTDVRRHLLGEVLVAPPPSRCPAVVQLDLDAHDGDWQRVCQFLARLRVLRLGYMLEKSTLGAHVSIRLGNPGCGVTARELQRVIEKLLRNQGWSDQRGELREAVRVDTTRGLRLPFAENMVVRFSHTSMEFKINDPGVARAAWDCFLSLPVHRFTTLERRANQIRRPVGRPRRTPSLSFSFLSIRANEQEDPDTRRSGVVHAKEHSTNKLRLSLPRANPSEALKRIRELVPSARRNRHKRSPDVVGALFRAGYSPDLIERITWDWLSTSGSEDARSRPEWAKQQLRTVIDYFQATYRPTRRRSA